MNLIDEVLPLNPIAAICKRIEDLTSLQVLQRHEERLKEEFKPIFEPIPHINELLWDVVAEIHVKDAFKTIKTCTYQCPRKYREAWKTLIQQHLEAGRIQPSSSPFASPAFIIPKSDPTVLPHWVNDYRQLNANTILDSHPIPCVDDILHDCAKGKIWATIDMTNSFFQTRMHPAHVPLTAVSTPFGLFEWLVMPMGLRNALAIHQCHVSIALKDYIGKICHVYLDDIVIWSESVEEHHENIQKILQALQDARLYVNPAKTHLYCTAIDFLGHRISAAGIEADGKKVERILKWPRLKSATDVRSFLGLVRYISTFLPHLTTHTDILTELTTKSADKDFPPWTPTHQFAFDAIKEIVIGRGCLTTIDHNDPSKKIFVTTDASDHRSGAVLSFGDTWETARPVAFDSMTFKNAELNYPVHEKELLAIIRTLHKWRAELFGATFVIFTDHKTLENFDKQRDLSRWQARWMEFLSQFDCKIVYVKGEANSVTDSLSRLPYDLDSDTAIATASSFFEVRDPSVMSHCVNVILPVMATSPFYSAHSLTLAPVVPTSVSSPPTLHISTDTKLLDQIKSGYTTDHWCRKLLSASAGMTTLTSVDSLWYVGSRLIVPHVGNIRESLFRLTHDTLGHFGFDKSYAALRDAYYWPLMRRDLQEGYISSCRDCQHNKLSTTQKAGPLHPLPIPDAHGNSIAMDFIGPLPEEDGFNCIVTITDREGSDIRIIPTRTDITAPGLASLFFEHWYCNNGLPLDIICDRDKLFISKFWKALTKLTGVKLKMSSAYHPQTDGASERTNKTVNQALHFHVSRTQHVLGFDLI
ncbi:Transposon Tf2-6 polyprotein [Hypsizygus marmoreus]|uniref:Transposon Tf2-6 polyprotein n=1 Tax=Hypsizygus marmoreus TaxID=39966 RepID=A0A369J3U1_HYPMA|nr:Transposon Tf2-6 polyprotein [Hypsizygus marmoreus]